MVSVKQNLMSFCTMLPIVTSFLPLVTCFQTVPRAFPTTSFPLSMAKTPSLSNPFKALKKTGTNPSLPNPFKALPWNARKENERDVRQKRVESAKLHRDLGITDDASYQEITTITDSLIAKADYEGDIKLKVKTEIAKDNLLIMRLNERIKSLDLQNDFANEQSEKEKKFDNDDGVPSDELKLLLEKQSDDEEQENEVNGEDKSKSKKRRIRVPTFLADLYLPPDAEHRKKVFNRFGLIMGISAIFPKAADMLGNVNFLVAASLVSNRGTTLQASMNMFTGRGSPPGTGKGLGLSAMMWLFLKVTVLTSSIPDNFGGKYANLLELLLVNTGLAIFSLYIRTNKKKTEVTVGEED